MPTFKSFGAYSAEVAKLAKELDRESTSKITREMAEKAQKIADAAASANLGGDPKFSGWAPLLDTQLKDGRDGSTIMTPTRTSAGPWTVAFTGRNRGNASGFSGPGINKRTGTTSRTKSGGIRKVRASKARRWNGYTDSKVSIAALYDRMEAETVTVAEDGVRKVFMRHFDMT